MIEERKITLQKKKKKSTKIIQNASLFLKRFETKSEKRKAKSENPTTTYLWLSKK
jgi:hypothetical protein